MASITVRFDANALKNELNRIIDGKVRSVTNDSETYEDLSWSFRDALAEYLPVDTGALAHGDSGLSENGYYRRGDIHTTSKGLVYAPVEYRPSKDVYYAGYVIKDDMIQSASTSPRFVDEAKEIIVRKMNNG